MIVRPTRWQRIKYGCLFVQVIPDERPLRPQLKISAYSGTFERRFFHFRPRWLRMPR